MSRPEEIVTESEGETRQFARSVADELQPGDVLCLKGALGAGKTQFVKGLASAFGIDPQQVHSPTFTLINEYDSEPPLYHFDCYRMEHPEEALEIGVEEYFYGEGVSIVEWPEKIAPFLPADARWITIEILGSNRRRFILGNRN